MNRTRLTFTLMSLLALGGASWFVWTHLHEPTPNGQSSIADSDVESVSRGSMVLTSTQLQSADLQVESVQVTNLELSRSLSGRLAYDDTKHVSVRISTDGVLQSVLVNVGDVVDVGQPIAVLQSPPVGEARTAVLAAANESQLTAKNADWHREIREGVLQLTDAMRRNLSVEQIESEFKQERTGDYGGNLLFVYTSYLLAEKNAQALSGIGDSGAVSGRVLRERQTARRQAAASLQATIQQSLFETEQSQIKADAESIAAERRLRVAQQSLATLLGPKASGSEDSDLLSELTDLSKLTIVSPIAGTIQKKVFSATERVSSQDELFVIADTSRLWVEADVRNRDWNEISITEGDTIEVSVPALGPPSQSATVVFLGREVDSASGSIPLVASIDNSEDRYRPGQFARVSVRTRILRDVLAIPSSAVVDLDGQASVFVQEGKEFRPVAVDVGQRASERVEIRSGLTPGQSVVTSGAFLLKSEWLLEDEE